MGEMAVLVFFAVFFGFMTLIARSTRDRLREEIRRQRKAPLSEVFKARETLSGMWRVSDYTPLNYDRAFTIGLFSGVVMFLLVLALFRGVAPAAAAVGLVAAALCFTGFPFLLNDHLIDNRVKDFRKHVEFGLETLVSVLIGTGGDLGRAVEEVARVGQGAVGKEFAHVWEDIASKKTMRKAFDAMALRVPCQEARDIAGAAHLYETVGGASALTLFKDLAGLIQENAYNRSRVEKQFGSVRKHAWLVGALPVATTVFFIFQHSWSVLLLRTPAGHGALALAGFLYLVAFGLIYYVFQSIEA